MKEKTNCVIFIIYSLFIFNPYMSDFYWIYKGKYFFEEEHDSINLLDC